MKRYLKHARLMYMFPDITQKENVFRKVKKLDCDISLDNVAFNLTRFEESSQVRITEALKVKRKLNIIKAMIIIIKGIKQNKYITKNEEFSANAKKIIISNIDAAKMKAKKATTN